MAKESTETLKRILGFIRLYGLQVALEESGIKVPADCSSARTKKKKSKSKTSWTDMLQTKPV